MKCCVVGCKSHSDGRCDTPKSITFHLFPRSKTMKQLWLQAINRNNWTSTKYTKICSLHFNDSDLVMSKRQDPNREGKRRRLRQGAIPRLNLNEGSLKVLSLKVLIKELENEYLIMREKADGLLSIQVTIIGKNVDSCYRYLQT